MKTIGSFDLSILRDADIRIIQANDPSKNMDKGLFLQIKRQEGIQSVKKFLLSSFNSLNIENLQIMYKKKLICTNNLIIALNQLKHLSES